MRPSLSPRRGVEVAYYGALALCEALSRNSRSRIPSASLTGLPREGRKPVRDATYAEVGFVRGQILAHITLKRNMRPSH
jgi:hypothetical protein